MTKSRIVWVALLLGLVPAAAQRQTPLPMGSTSTASTASESAAEFTVTLESAGFLTVIVRAAKGVEEDLILSITDNEHQTLPNARSDQDLDGAMSSEQIVARITEPGTYRVIVESYGYGTVAFEVGGTFLSTNLAAATADPDGRPSQALSLGVGAMHENSLDPSDGDAWDWFSFTAKTSGVLTVLTRATDDGDGDGDLKLEIFRDGDFREPFDTSDGDAGGILTNESLNADVTAGETIYVRVSPSFGGGRHVSYRIASGLIPN